MDFGDFHKAVTRAADALAPAAERAAPAFKFGSIAAVTAAGLPFAPFLVAVPEESFLPLPVSVPLFLFSQDFRDAAGRHAEESAPKAVPLLFAHFLASGG